MTLSPYWIPAELQENHWIRQQVFNYRRGEPAIHLLSRMQALSPEAAECFRDVMIGGPHSISLENWQQLKPVVSDQTDPEAFALKTADVVDWNGKLVIVTDGIWTEFAERAHSLFVDAEGDGKYVEEVVYQAPISQYKEALNEAMLGLRSIEWKTHSRW